MKKSLEQKKEQIAFYREKNPAYNEILEFYEKVLTEQELIKTMLNIAPPELKKELKNFHEKEGFSLLNKEDFYIDLISSASLFESLCRIGKITNEKMNNSIQVIENAISNKNLVIEELLKRHFDESYMERISLDNDIDKTILKFLIYMSILPSINTQVEMLEKNLNTKNWLKGYCPICGELPFISELKGEGQRYLLCSFCNLEWQSERLKCPFCGNNDHNKLHFFYVEGIETHRVDLCDNCQQYIKTVDSRKLNYEPDLNLEDITTMHFDILASEKGFKRPVTSPFGL
ncbi:MAG: formate dehydrogenase accessory protein FdhE [Nitrospirae bacterium]|nr:formate dehydrogenase accessory protein FdhE [Nitrospirota bacterium]